MTVFRKTIFSNIILKIIKLYLSRKEHNNVLHCVKKCFKNDFNTEMNSA